MPTKLKLLYIVPGVIVIFAFIIYFAMKGKQAPPPSPAAANLPNQSFYESFTGTTASSTSPLVVGETAPPRVPSPEVLKPLDSRGQTEITLKSQAAVFAERWGTYAAGQSISNVASLLPLMTESLHAYAVTNPQKQGNINAGYAITTRTLSVHDMQVNDADGTAVMVITTQRVESAGQETGRTFYQDLELRYKKVGNAWKVDGVFWKDEINKPK